MLLHDSYFHPTNQSINATHHNTITKAYSPLFDSTLTLIISIFGLLFNVICCIKLWFIIYQYRERKTNKTNQSQESIHILSHNKYRFLFILTSNDVLLSLTTIISCLDEKFFFQSFLARHHLCAAQVLIWKFTLHFIPLLIIAILCRYHYILKKDFQMKSSNFSTLNQLLCTDLSILIPFVLALAWSVDGLWLWGVANIKDFIIHSSPPSIEENNFHNETTSSSMQMNTSLSDVNPSLKSEEQNDDGLYLPEQKTICYLQTNHNFQFTVRLVHLIQADFLLLFSLHLIGLILEIALHIRLCCCVTIKKITSIFQQERQLCIYILYIFITITLTSFPFYFYRTIEIIFDIQFTSINSDLLNSRIFAQILLLGICFKPLLFFILFFPSSVLFKLKCYLKCYSPVNIQILDPDEQISTTSNNQNQQERIIGTKRHYYSLFIPSSFNPKFHSRFRTQSSPIIKTTNQRQESLTKSEHFGSWLRLTNAIINDNSKETSNTEFV